MESRFWWKTFIIVLTLAKHIYTNSVPNTCVCLHRTVQSLKNPVYLHQTTDGTDRFLVAEQSGVIHQYSSKWTRTKYKPSVWLDISSRVVHDGTLMDERGLLGFTLHPNFKENKKVYLYSIRTYNNFDYAYVTEIVERSGRGDEDTETILLAIQQPHHQRNGGQLLFGKDGYLYIFVGDGGVPDNTGDAGATQAQDRTTLLGKVLRIDVDNTDIVNNKFQNYKVPDDNPFVQNSTWLPEIYAYGCRNMWRCGADFGSVNGNMFCGDTGSSFQEEINIIKAGGNYGWNLKEGDHCMQPGFCDDIENEVPPVYAYAHRQYSAVIGGYVYRGKALTDLIGKYVFTDMSSQGFSTLSQNASGQWIKGNLSICTDHMCPCNARDTPGSTLISFSQDNDGELYAILVSPMKPTPNGEIFKLVPPLTESLTCGASVHLPNCCLLLMLVLVFLNFLIL